MGKHDENIDIRSYSVPPEPEEQEIYSSRAAEKKAIKKKKKRSHTGRNILIVVLSVFLVAVIAIGSFAFYTFHDLKYPHFELDEAALSVDKTDSNKDIINIAMFGLDSRQNPDMSGEEGSQLKGRSDTIMILSVNKKTNEIKLISVMRDSAVMVDGKYRKINSAYYRGGAEMAVKTLNENFGLDITDYVTVNFFGLANLIDAVGGVEVEVTQAEIDNKYYGVNAQIKEQANIMGIEPILVTEPGLQTLDGNQAVAWARIRKEKTAWGEADDYGRTARQRLVLSQMLSKAKSSSPFKYRELLEALMPCIETSLEFEELWPIGWAVLFGDGMEQARIPHTGYTGGEIKVTGGVHYDVEVAEDMIKEFIYNGKTFEQYAEEDKNK